MKLPTGTKRGCRINERSKAIDYLDSLQEQGIPGCDCVIYKDHEEVFRHTTGFADHQMTKPLTKAILTGSTRLKGHHLHSPYAACDKGSIGLDDPVSKYLPEYKEMMVKEGSSVRKAENAMTIRHLLTMQSVQL